MENGECKRCSLEGCLDCLDNSTCDKCDSLRGYFLDEEKCEKCQLSGCLECENL